MSDSADFCKYRPPHLPPRLTVANHPRPASAPKNRNKIRSFWTPLAQRNPSIWDSFSIVSIILDPWPIVIPRFGTHFHAVRSCLPPWPITSHRFGTQVSLCSIMLDPLAHNTPSLLEPLAQNNPSMLDSFVGFNLCRLSRNGSFLFFLERGFQHFRFRCLRKKTFTRPSMFVDVHPRAPLINVEKCQTSWSGPGCEKNVHFCFCRPSLRSQH